MAYPIDRFIPLASVTGQTPRALQRDRKDLYAMEYGLSVQQTLPAAFVLDTGYFASQGRRLFERTYVNDIDPLTGQRPLAGFGQIDLKRNDANSSFNALHVSLQRNFTRGWLFGLRYMWSHSINDGSVGGGESNAPQNVLCRVCDRGPSGTTSATTWSQILFTNSHSDMASHSCRRASPVPYLEGGN